MKQIRNQEGKKPPGILNLLMWLGIVSVVVWGLVALCCMYPDAAIFQTMGHPLGKLSY